MHVMFRSRKRPRRWSLARGPLSSLRRSRMARRRNTVRWALGRFAMRRRARRSPARTAARVAQRVYNRRTELRFNPETFFISITQAGGSRLENFLRKPPEVTARRIYGRMLHYNMRFRTREDTIANAGLGLVRCAVYFVEFPASEEPLPSAEFATCYTDSTAVRDWAVGKIMYGPRNPYCGTRFRVLHKKEFTLRPLIGYQSKPVFEDKFITGAIPLRRNILYATGAATGALPTERKVVCYLYTDANTAWFSAAGAVEVEGGLRLSFMDA